MHLSCITFNYLEAQDACDEEHTVYLVGFSFYKDIFTINNYCSCMISLFEESLFIITVGVDTRASSPSRNPFRNEPLLHFY